MNPEMERHIIVDNEEEFNLQTKYDVVNIIQYSPKIE